MCPHCGLDIHAFWKSKDWVEKLIVALRHPDSMTRTRAAWLLGKTGDPRAVDALIRLLRTTRDPYLAGEAVLALGETENRSARRFLKTLSNHSQPALGDKARWVLGETQKPARV